MQMGEMKNAWDKGSIYRLERGFGEVAAMWHPRRCHKGDTWAKETSHVNVNIQSFLTHVWANLKEGVGDKGLRSVEGVKGVGSLKGFSHMCKHTVRN